ncbi:MAG: ankyrin repeat domain-containing protein [Elusimicrobia bacterium]|nr:ankyrin repeat domain-containing protein [Elusimicrobiota bacterium]
MPVNLLAVVVSAVLGTGALLAVSGCAGPMTASGPSSQAASKPKTIHEAAGAGDLAAVRAFLSRGVAVDSRDSNEFTALHHAAWAGQIAVMDELLAAGAAVEARDVNGETPLHFAARNGKAEAVHRLLARGAAADARTKNGATPLMWAAGGGHVSVAEALLVMGADPAARTDQGDTPLHAAATAGKAAVIELLVSKGVEVDPVDKTGGTPLFNAGIQKHPDAVAALLKAGAKPGGNNGLVGLEVKDSSGTISVVKAVPGRPAERAGIKPGDVIVSVDGRSTEGLGLTKTVKLLRGPAGAKVVVAVQRPGVAQPQEFTLIREAAVAAPASAAVSAGQSPRGREDAPSSSPQPTAAAPAFRAAASDADEPRYQQAERPDDIAVVIGVEKYAKLPSAEFAERDASAVSRHFLSLGVPQRNLILLTGQAATRASIQGYVEEWLPRNVKPGSRVFFYYSGHGAPDPKTGDAFLVPWDGDPMFLKSSAYPLRDLFSRLGKLGAAEVVVAVDACFSGAGGRSVLAKGARPLVASVQENVLPESGMSLLSAASGEEITGTLEDQGHGAFTYHLLKGLNQGRRSTRQLYDYLKPKVSDDARRQNREQTPGFNGSDISF